MSRQNLMLPDAAVLTTGDVPVADRFVVYARAMAETAYEWYRIEKNRKGRRARLIRAGAIIFMGVSGVIPILSVIFTVSGTALISPAWASVALAIAGTLILFDRFFGFSTGWMRYIDAMLAIRSAVSEFDLEIARLRNGLGEQIDETEATKVIAQCGTALVRKVNEIIQGESGKWNNEFSSAISKMDEQLKKSGKTGSGKPDPAAVSKN